MQSAYGTPHLTEIAFIKVLNDVFENVDAKLSIVIVAFDISATFDIISHAKILDRLRVDFGLSGVLLKWIASYLSVNNT